MKKAITSAIKVIVFIVVSSCGTGSVEPSPSSGTSQCGCSKYNKADCQSQTKCRWVVNDGCKCN